MLFRSDPVKLREATSLHAAEDNKGKRNEKLFEAILGESLSTDDLDELAKKFEGFQVAGMNVPKSSGKLGITLRKPEQGGDVLQRTVTVRRERSGWKVDEISGEGRFEQPIMIPRGRMGGGRRR